MVQKLLQNIAFMCFWAALSAINWTNVVLSQEAGLLLFFFALTLFSSLMVLVYYRRAKNIAKILDTPKTIVITMIEGKAKTEPEAEHDENENFGHPV